MANPEHLEEQREETRLIIEELLEDGSDPDALYTIEHHFSADDFDALEKLAVDPHRDRAQMLKVENVQQAWQQWINKLPPARREDEDVKEIRWMIEELRVSYFAQQLGTPYPISDKRILQAMEQISG